MDSHISLKADFLLQKACPQKFMLSAFNKSMEKLNGNLTFETRWVGSSSPFTVYLTVLAFNEKIHCVYLSVWKRYKNFLCVFGMWRKSYIFYHKNIIIDLKMEVLNVQTRRIALLFSHLNNNAATMLSISLFANHII